MTGAGVEFSIDWLTSTWRGLSAQEVIRTLARIAGSTWGLGYWTVLQNDEERFRAKGPSKSYIEQNKLQEWASLCLKGTACREIGTELLLALCRAGKELLGANFNPSRLDVAWDDHEKRITPKQFRKRFWDSRRKRKRPEVVCRAKRAHAYEDDSPEGGSGYRVGERVSERMLRIYDKSAESAAKIDAIRIELEVKGDAARSLLDDMLREPDDVPAVGLRHLVGYIDFREPRSYRSHVERRERCAWWRRFVGGATKATIARRTPVDLDEWARYYARQHGGAMGVLLMQHGGDPVATMETLLAGASRNENPRHRRYKAMIAQRWRRAREPEGCGGGDGGAEAAD